MSLEPLAVYDAPGVLASQVLENEVTLEGLKNLALSPDSLSPQERSDLGDRILAGEDDPGNFKEALVGALTNPFVWMYFMTGPAGGEFARKGVRLFGRTPVQRAKEAVKKHPGLLANFSMLTAQQQGSDVATVASRQVQNSMEARQRLDGDIMGTLGTGDSVVERLEKRYGLHSGLDPKRYPTGSEEQRLAQEIQVALTAGSGGWHRQSVENFAQGTQRRTLRKTEVIRDDYGAVIERRNVPYLENGEEVFFETYDKLVEWKRRNNYDGKKKRIEEVFEELEGSAGPRRKELFKELDELRETTPDIYVFPGPTTAAEKARPAVVSEKPLREFLFEEVPEAGEYLQRKMKSKRRMLVEAFGESDAGTEVVELFKGVEVELPVFRADREKVRRWARSLEAEGFNSVLDSADDVMEGDKMLHALFGPDAMQSVKEGILRGDDLIEGAMTQFRILEDQHFYTPYNLREGLEIAPSLDGGGLRAPNVAQLQAAEASGVDFPHLSNSTKPRSSKVEHIWDPDDIRVLDERFGLTEEGNAWRASNDRKISDRVERIEPISALKMGGTLSDDQYIQDMIRTASVHTDELQDSGKAMIKVVQGALREGAEEGRPGFDVVPTGFSRALAGVEGKPDRLTALEDVVHQRATPASAFDFAMKAEMDPHTAEKWRTTFMPFVSGGRTNIQHAVSNGNFMEAKRVIGALAKTTPVQKLKGLGGRHRALVQKLEVLGDPNATTRKGGVGLSGTLAKYLYVTHLGLNLGSMALNMTQPFLLAGTSLGFRNVAKGYARAMKEMVDYGQDRLRTYGTRRITRDERDVLIRRNFRWGDETGITATAHEILDRVEGTTPGTRHGAVEWWTTELPLKGFEKTEWLNRNVAAHAVEASMETAARAKPGPNQVQYAVERFVDETQFGMTPLNTPEMFINNRFFNNPLMRQFLGFSMRSFTSLVHTMPRLAQGTRGVGPISPLRLFGVEEISGYGPALANDILRGMGMSAIVYEGTKGLLGTDLSRGLFFESSTDLVGLSSLAEEDEDVIPLPPVIDIPTDMVKAVGSGDEMQMKLALSRTFPGGVAITRALGSMPEIEGLSSLQRRYIDWDDPLDSGEVPLRDSDGSLIKYVRPTDAILQGMGVDLGRFEQSGGIDGVLIRNRDEILDARRRYVEATQSNEFRKAQGIAGTFERRFGFPLTVTEEQLESYHRLRRVPRTERILDRTDKSARPLYARQIQQKPAQKLPVDLTKGSTSRERRENQPQGFSPYEAFRP